MATTPEDELFGTDIWLGQKDGAGNFSLDVTPAGDWRKVSGREAVRQSLIRDFISNPGEWKTRPEYGAGLKALVKKAGTVSNIDQAKNRIKARARADKRVASVNRVDVQHTGSMVTFDVSVQLVGDDRPLIVKGTVD